MAETVRTIHEDEAQPWVMCTGVGFLAQLSDDFAEYVRGELILDRTWAAFDGDDMVGTMRSWPTDLTVPGPATVTAAALTGVTVLPTHRRRGLLSEMMAAQLDDAVDRGEPVGILIASEYPIYGRFGYGAAAFSAHYTVDLTALRFRREVPGTIELVDRATLGAIGPELYDSIRVARPGAIERPGQWWNRNLHLTAVPDAPPPKGYQALYRSERGEPQGFVRYEADQRTEDLRPQGEITVVELQAATPAAYQKLWQFCRDIDLVVTAKAADRPVDELLPWLVTDARVLRQTGRYDFLWVRILDARAALGGRRYAVSGRLVIEVVDQLGFTPGRFMLEGGPEGSDCVSTDREPDLTVPVDALGSVYLGGVSWSALVGAGTVDVCRDDAVVLADAMFRTAEAPWCSTWF
jgi:predicted acetyltransferase